MTCLGAPMIYYGDEAGMWSPDDPSDRQPMTWPGMKFDDPQVGFDQHIFDQYRRLIAIRRALPALQAGDYWPAAADDAANTLVIARGDGRQTVYVAFNRSAEPRTVTVPIDPSAGPLVNWMRPAVGMAADGRPTATPAIDMRPLTPDAAGDVRISLPPWGVAILAPPPPR